MAKKKLPKLPFDLNYRLSKKYAGVLNEMCSSTRKVVIQNYQTGLLQLVRDSHVSMLTSDLVDDTIKGRGTVIFKAQNRRLFGDERNELSEIYCYYCDAEVKYLQYRAQAEEVLGIAKRKYKNVGIEDELTARLKDEDPEVRGAREQKKAMFQEAKELMDEADAQRDRQKALAVWFAKMVIPFRKEHEKERLISANEKVLQEEALREQVRESARRRVSDTMSASETDVTQVFKKEINHPDKIDQGDPGAPEEVSPDDETKEMLIDQK